MLPIEIKAPIKINLALHVVGQDSGGYHLLQTVVTFATTGGDQITISPARIDDVHVEGVYALDIGGGKAALEDNLIVKARDLLRTELGGKAFPIHLKLVKNIPVASGLGGGSADAAAVLLALARFWQGQNKMEEKRLHALAQRLGADVPMCLHALQYGMAVLAEGIGNRLKALPGFPALDIVIVNPGKTLSTKRVFCALQEKNNAPLVFTPDDFTSVDRLVMTLGNTRNDLGTAACNLLPEISHLMEKLWKTGAEFVRMSGSGASCFGIYKNWQLAWQAATDLKHQNPDYFVLPTRTFGGGTDKE